MLNRVLLYNEVVISSIGSCQLLHLHLLDSCWVRNKHLLLHELQLLELIWIQLYLSELLPLKVHELTHGDVLLIEEHLLLLLLEMSICRDWADVLLLLAISLLLLAGQERLSFAILIVFLILERLGLLGKTLLVISVNNLVKDIGVLLTKSTAAFPLPLAILRHVVSASRSGVSAIVRVGITMAHIVEPWEVLRLHLLHESIIEVAIARH